MTHPWDSLPRNSGDFAKWTDPGQSVVGTISYVGLGEDFDKNPCPEISVEIEGGPAVTITAGQASLKTKLLEAKPEVGDQIAVLYQGTEDNGRGGTIKKFDVKVKRAGGGTSPVSAGTFPNAADLLA